MEYFPAPLEKLVEPMPGRRANCSTSFSSGAGKCSIFCCSFALFACCKQQNENHVHRFPRRCFRPCRAIRLLYAAKILPAALAEVCR